MFVIVAVATLVMPPVVLGEVTTRTYALTAAVLILAVGSALPYAVLVALGTLPLLYAGVASFAAPQPAAETPHTFSTATAIRHTVAGISYVLGAAAVGAIGIGVQMGMRSDLTAIPTVFQPSFLYLGGVLVAVAFVSLQLWRYDTSLGVLGRRTVLGTVALGILLALSPAVAFWVFNGAF
jgi:hypothetical protein